MRERPRRTPLLVVVTLVAATLATSVAAALDRGAAGDPRLRQALDRVAAAGAPGAIALVRVGDGTVRLTSGYGKVKPRTPIRASDRFRVGSLTKTFVATVVLQLVGERKLSLGDTVERCRASSRMGARLRCASC